MSLITDFRKTVRGHITRDRSVSAATQAEQILRLAVQTTGQPTTSSQSAIDVVSPKEASGTNRASGDRQEGTEAVGSPIPVAKRRRCRLVVDNSPIVTVKTPQGLSGSIRSETVAVPEGANVPLVVSTMKTSKAAAVLRLLEREGGATLTEIMAATAWQAHSVRGFFQAPCAKSSA